LHSPHSQLQREKGRKKKKKKKSFLTLNTLTESFDRSARHQRLSRRKDKAQNHQEKHLAQKKKKKKKKSLENFQHQASTQQRS
jgi:hypothetical protein